jgi:hypothetical protein
VGCVDFFIPSKNWCIRLLRGESENGMPDSCFRFDGAYGEWLTASAIKDYIILDFQSSLPSERRERETFWCARFAAGLTSFQDIEKLFHVVFSNATCSSGLILNSLLEKVDEFALLDQ